MHVFRSLYAILSPQRRVHLALAVALMIIAALIEMTTVGVAAQFLAVAANTRLGGSGPGGALFRWLEQRAAGYGGKALFGAALVAAVMATASARLLITWFTLKFSNAIGRDLTARIWSNILFQSYRDYINRNSSLVLGGIEKVRPAVFNVIYPSLQAVSAAFVALLIALLLLVIDYKVAALISATTLTIFLGSSLFNRARLHANSLAAAAAITARTKLVQEGLGGFRDILLTRSQAIFQRRLDAIERTQSAAALSNTVITVLPRLFGEAGAVSGIVLVIVIATHRPGGLQEALPVLGAFALGGQRLLLMTQQAFSGWAQARGNFRLLVDVLALIPPAAQDPASAPEPIDPDAQNKLTFEQLRLSDIGFAYSPDRPILKGIDLTLRRGERIGLIGVSGSGKSTLLDLLMGLLPPTHGTLQIDALPLDEVTVPRWQATLAHVPQHIYLADETIAANIAFGIDTDLIDRARLHKAAADAGLADVVAALPHGLETLVGERGIRLSGGQRQRIGIARALFRRPAVLILDEATSALDDATEAQLLDTLAHAYPDITLIIVAHRTSSLRICDRIVEILDGRIVE